MSPAERLSRAAELIEQAVAEIEDAGDDVPAFSVDALRFLKAELKVSIRRIGNVRKVLSSGTQPAA